MNKRVEEFTHFLKNLTVKEQNEAFSFMVNSIENHRAKKLEIIIEERNLELARMEKDIAELENNKLIVCTRNE